MRKKKNINLGMIGWSNTKFSKLTSIRIVIDSKENYKFDLEVKRWRQITSMLILN